MSTSRLIMAQRRTNKGEGKTFSPGPCFRGRRGISDGEEETSHTEVLYFFFFCETSTAECKKILFPPPFFLRRDR